MPIPSYSKPGYIEPVGRIGDYLHVWWSGVWAYRRIVAWESIPRSQAILHDFGAVNANTTLALATPTPLILRANEMIQMRFAPLDDIDVRLWIPSTAGKFALDRAHARVDLFTAVVDPDYVGTEFFALGPQRDVQLQIANQTAYDQATSRVVFWGHRFVLTPPLNLSSMQPSVASEIKRVAHRILADAITPGIEGEVA